MAGKYTLDTLTPPFFLFALSFKELGLRTSFRSSTIGFRSLVLPLRAYSTAYWFAVWTGPRVAIWEAMLFRELLLLLFLAALKSLTTRERTRPGSWLLDGMCIASRFALLSFQPSVPIDCSSPSSARRAFPTRFSWSQPCFQSFLSTWN